MSFPDDYWKFRSAKNAQRCGEKCMCKSKPGKPNGLVTILDVMSRFLKVPAHKNTGLKKYQPTKAPANKTTSLKKHI